MLLYVQELAKRGSSKPQDNPELLALKGQVSKLTAEKTALMEKHKKSSKKKRLVSAFSKQSTSFIRLVFIRILLTKYSALRKSLKIQEGMVLDLKVLMYRNTDEIEKLKKIKADSDKEMLQALQQVKNLSNSNTVLQ